MVEYRFFHILRKVCRAVTVFLFLSFLLLTLSFQSNLFQFMFLCENTWTYASQRTFLLTLSWARARTRTLLRSPYFYFITFRLHVVYMYTTRMHTHQQWWNSTVFRVKVNHTRSNREMSECWIFCMRKYFNINTAREKEYWIGNST